MAFKRILFIEEWAIATGLGGSHLLQWEAQQLVIYKYDMKSF